MCPLTVKDFRHSTEHKWDDISSEKYRCYEFLDEMKVVKIENPLALSVSQSGGHRVFDAQGKSHYITPGWSHLWWEVHDGQPHFVK